MPLPNWAPPRLLIDEEDSTPSSIRLSDSGSFSFGDFRADERGFTLGDKVGLAPMRTLSVESLETPTIRTTPSSASSSASSLSTSTRLSSASSTSMRAGRGPPSTTSASSAASSFSSPFPHSSSSPSLPSIPTLGPPAYASASASAPSSFTLQDIHILSPHSDGRLGRGASGSVHKAVHTPSHSPVAVKQIPMEMSETKARQVLMELRALSSSQCEQIVGFHGAFYKERMMTLVLEYMDGGSLKDFMTKLRDHEKRSASPTPRVTEQHMALVTAQVLHGLHYLHTVKRIVHRDIKPSNILVNSKGEVKLADFGVSGAMGEEAQGRAGKTTFVGTLVYMSPERIQGLAHGYDSDVWSLGLTIMECLQGRFPYQPSTPENRKKNPPLPKDRGSGRAANGARTPHSSSSATSLLSSQRTLATSPTSSPLLSPNTPSPSSSSYLYNATNTTVQTPPKPSRPSPTPQSASSSLFELPAAAPLPIRRESSFCFWGAHDCIVKDAPPSLNPALFSAEACDFFRRCLQKEPAKRPTTKELLGHPWLARWRVSDEEDREVLRRWIKEEVDASAAGKAMGNRVNAVVNVEATIGQKRRRTSWGSAVDAAQSPTPPSGTQSGQSSGAASATTSVHTSVSTTPAFLTPSHAAPPLALVTSPSLFSSFPVLPPLPPLTKSTSSAAPQHSSSPSSEHFLHSSRPPLLADLHSSPPRSFPPLVIEVPKRKRKREDNGLRHPKVVSLGEAIRERERQREERPAGAAAAPGAAAAAKADGDLSVSPQTSPISGASTTSSASLSSLCSLQQPPSFRRLAPDVIVPSNAPGSPFGHLSIFAPFSPAMVGGVGVMTSPAFAALAAPVEERKVDGEGDGDMPQSQ